jgi:peptide/nickel transport system substrate-binding protein
MGTLRYIFKLISAYISRFKGVIVISIVFGALFFLLLLYLLPRFSPNEVRIGVNGRYYSEQLPDSILFLLSEGLTRIGNDGVIEPAIAVSWETPDKGKTWVFTLKDNLFWQDGTPITSQSIQYDFSDVEIERPDDYTIVFKLQEPFSLFPSVVSEPIFKKGLLGMKNWKVESISVVGNYVEKLELVDENKHVQVFRFYPTIERTKLAFKLGEVDMLMNMYDPKPFDTWSTVQIEPSINQNQVVTLFFNTQDAHLSEKSLRQALAYAIDKSSFGERAISNIPSYSWAYNPQVKPYEYDLKRAKDLIADLPKETMTDLQLKLYTSPNLLSTAEMIAEDWKELGIPTSVQVSTSTPTEFQAFLTLYDIPKDPDQYSIWHSTQISSNISRYSSPRADKLLEDGRTVIELEERRKVYLDFQRFLMEDLPAVFLYHPISYSIIRK